MSATKAHWANKAERCLSWAVSAEAKADALVANHNRDWAFISQPGHLPARAREMRQTDRAMELRQKAVRYRAKAAELRRMATTNAGDAEARKTAYRAALDSVIELGMYVDCIYGVRRVEKVNTKSLRLAGALGPVTIDKTLCRVLVERCGTCADWKGGECWSGDRLDGDLSNGSAGSTLAAQTCEAWRPAA
jgi:hypothetical protein